MDDHNQGIFSPNYGTFFQFSKKGRGDFPPLPPSSYAPDTDSAIFLQKETFSPEFCRINHLKNFYKGDRE